MGRKKKEPIVKSNSFLPSNKEKMAELLKNKKLSVKDEGEGFLSFTGSKRISDDSELLSGIKKLMSSDSCCSVMEKPAGMEGTEIYISAKSIFVFMESAF